MERSSYAEGKVRGAMFRTILLLGGCLSARAESGDMRPPTEEHRDLRQVVTPSDIFSVKDPLHQHRAARSASFSDVGDCVLLLGSFCNGKRLHSAAPVVAVAMTLTRHFRRDMPLVSHCYSASSVGIE